ncbi:MAG: hypothetical protein A2W52_02850 [Candidatus Taylorbacteria bacterium RIFCSPHIGHO2_02_49_25]|uniref:Glutamate--tRNA ligase n=1 Tax=Candidatus Taylorbacteria bacterium RIFCSPHIGHO2_02_49_25 TaxID=1802305 RepID=A0A1G2MIG3_9BACT|nr:MAG: Glutamate-tRNA ligase [Parcubacteria group bacterium GW2011_GWF2_50_9]OHA21069.1 MAG: hypothetical protein A2759_00075 [Candidatus Taylorbacteria bacterium RIFCSPHIGHO2_01_FULL_49_60]OHA23676.1 MAG: hypothetical protein A2W52_02850 [Candidatus Taylorbacteria bacterium RIFCSPHIGHO2_02_49_25]OHA35757.1 MAG: hypothetical protein A3B27_02310 [Candidatus Taylorbacteria bacterium RIFCSPLOWO2_01_FULL_50_130]OHA40711.1 MAG: hypothetical protein A3H73_03730 [Candidatus Taylorbacteria bacterium R
MKIVTRFPPSPTGNLHIGGARTALFNYLFTKHHGGKIYLRLEDTDEERSRQEYEQNILDSLQWLGFSLDALPDGSKCWKQSERKDTYRKYLKELIAGGRAYLSKETEGKRQEVIRFKNPNKKIAFDDLIRDSIEFDTTELGDMVIARSLEEPLYHLAVVVDDYEMGVTHVIRGEDHISNTPRQILLQEALGFPRPVYVHIPLILAPDKSKLSKRHGAVSVTEYRDRGYLPEAFINYLALLGWNPGGEKEVFTLQELIREFDLDKVQKGGAIFNEEKLRWINRKHIERLGGPLAILPYIPDTLLRERAPGEKQAIAEMLFERVSFFGEVRDAMERGEYDYLLREPKYPKELLTWQKATSEPGIHFPKILSFIEALPEAFFTKSAVREAVMPYAEANGKGNVLWPMRVALSGKQTSPDPFTLAAMLGKATSVRRLKAACERLKA